MRRLAGNGTAALITMDPPSSGWFAIRPWQNRGIASRPEPFRGSLRTGWTLRRDKRCWAAHDQGLWTSGCAADVMHRAWLDWLTARAKPISVARPATCGKATLPGEQAMARRPT
jgi:hypothetical protein